MSESLTITEINIPAFHPGEYLAEDLEHLRLTARQFAKAIGVSPNRISEILNGKRSITADTALRIGQYFGTGARIWLDLQLDYDLQRAEQKAGEQIRQEIKPLQATSH